MAEDYGDIRLPGGSKDRIIQIAFDAEWKNLLAVTGKKIVLFNFPSGTVENEIEAGLNETFLTLCVAQNNAIITCNKRMLDRVPSFVVQMRDMTGNIYETKRLEAAEVVGASISKEVFYEEQTLAVSVRQEREHLLDQILLFDIINLDLKHVIPIGHMRNARIISRPAIYNIGPLFLAVGLSGGIATGNAMQMIESCRDSDCTAVCFSDDYTLLCTGFKNGEIVCYERFVEDDYGQQQAKVLLADNNVFKTVASGEVTRLAFSGDNNQIHVGLKDGTVETFVAGMDGKFKHRSRPGIIRARNGTAEVTDIQPTFDMLTGKNGPLIVSYADGVINIFKE